MIFLFDNIKMVESLEQKAFISLFQGLSNEKQNEVLAFIRPDLFEIFAKLEASPILKSFVKSVDIPTLEEVVKFYATGLSVGTDHQCYEHGKIYSYPENEDEDILWYSGDTEFEMANGCNGLFESMTYPCCREGYVPKEDEDADDESD